MAGDLMGWWFGVRSDDGKVRLPHGDGRIVIAGQTLSVEGEIVPCTRGLHASARALDALQYAPSRDGLVVARVRLHGTVVAHGSPVDKHAASHRTVLWMADCDEALRWFATDVAEAALLTERKLGREPDRRSWNAITVARRYLQRLATKEELDAAWDAAGVAAWAAARAAARAAAGDAAWVAAWAAARDAAWDAARAAARAAAGDAARAAAGAAAGAVADGLLTANLEGLAPETDHGR